MPLFIPINPPPAADPESLEATAKDSAQAGEQRIEEHVCRLIQEYKQAMLLWSKGQIAEVQAQLDKLLEDPLIAETQELHVESECTAYCREHGGVSMGRLRSLVHTNAGMAKIAGDTSLSKHIGSPNIDFAQLASVSGKVLCEALEHLTEAVRLGKGNASHYLVIGQCAMLLGQLDVAVDAFRRGFEGPRISGRLGPGQWWCVQEMVRAALLRGDPDLACDIVDRVATEWPDMAKLLNKSIGRPEADGRVPTAPVLRVGVAALPTVEFGEQHAAETSRDLRVISRDGRVYLAQLGEAIVGAFEHAMEVGDGLHGAVKYVIEEINAPKSVQIVPEMASAPEEPVESANDSAECEENETGDQEDGAHKVSSKRSAMDIDSGDEVPIKRRSNRFIERATHSVAAGPSLVSTKSVSSSCQQSRTLTMCIEPVVTELSTQARGAAFAWLDGDFGNDEARFTELMFAAKTKAAEAATKTGRIKSKASLEAWGLGEASKGRPYIEELKSTLVPLAASDDISYTVDLEACVEALDSNTGILDLLQRLYSLAVKEFAKAPQELLATTRMRNVLVRTLSAIHELLIDEATCENDGAAATLALILLADARASGRCDEYIYWEWQAVASRINNSQLEFIELWARYEAAVFSGNVSLAVELLAECKEIGGPHLDFYARCSLTGARVTIELVSERCSHALTFDTLARAEALAAKKSNEERSASSVLLRELLYPTDGSDCALAFTQHVQAARLLAKLEKQLGNPAGEASALVLELRLVTSRLLFKSNTCDANGTSRAVIVYCAGLLRSIHGLVVTDDPRKPSVKLVVDGSWGFSAVLITLALAMTDHFAPEPAAADANTPDASFVALSLWMATSIHPQAPETLKFLEPLHSLLGERGLCTAANGALLKYMLSLSISAIDAAVLAEPESSEEHFDCASACMRCLFDLRIQGRDTDTHACLAVEMDASSANAACRLVAPELRAAAQLRRGSGLRGDLKAIVDKTAAALGELDVDRYPRLSCNVDIIDDYLDGLAMPSFAQARRILLGEAVCHLPLRSTAHESVPAAFVLLPFVRAAAQHDTMRSRMRLGTSRALEDYDAIIDDYKLNLALDPHSADAWFHLAQAYADLADELLLGTASEIRDCRFDIGSLQRLALSCIVQARQLLPPLSESKNDLGLHARVFAFAGNLLYTITARPFSGMALQVLPSNVVVEEDEEGEESTEDPPVWNMGHWKGTTKGRPSSKLSQSLAKRYTVLPGPSSVYSLARRLFARAVHLDGSDWKYVYMLGKATAKIGNSVGACALYLKSFFLALGSNVSESGGGVLIPVANIPEVSLNPLYKLIATLVKKLHSKEMTVDMARRFLDALPFSNPVSMSSVDASEAASAGPRDADDGVMVGIRDLLSQMWSADRRRWNHRPVYLLAWINHHLLNDSEGAKQSLLGLLQLRAANKQLASFYKSEYEAPGKHYLYLEKYLLLYIDTLVATLDYESAQALARKLKRTSDSFFDAPKVADCVTNAEISIMGGMVRKLNCPKLVVDNSGSHHIILQEKLDPLSNIQVFSITRQCKLNRMHFNAARDTARSNIVFFTALQEHLGMQVAQTAKDAKNTRVQEALEAVTRYSEPLTRTMAIYGMISEYRKRGGEMPDVLSDYSADLFLMLLALYGQFKHPVLRHFTLYKHSLDLDSLCDAVLEGLQMSAVPQMPDGAFWQGIVFEEGRNDASLQYKLLDPLLEFQVSKLVDAVRDAKVLHPNPFTEGNSALGPRDQPPMHGHSQAQMQMQMQGPSQIQGSSEMHAVNQPYSMGHGYPPQQ
ncbi:Histone transcription regulator 3 [Coemansia sp. Benny D115]|nr:Histone transcription regulator 3 [Coemansia sp. Benny D115]